MKILYWDEAEKSNIQVIDKNRSIKLGTFNNCTFHGISKHYPSPLLKSEGELLLPTIEKFMSLGRGTIYEDNMEYEIEPKICTNVCSDPVFYFVYNNANYFHWIYDTIPYLYSFFKLKNEYPDLKLLMSPAIDETDLYPFIYESLELLGLVKQDIIFLNTNTLYEKVYVGSSLTHNRMSNDPPHKGVYGVLNIMDSSPSDKKRVYISRRTWTQPKSENIGTDYTQKRKCVNEDEVVELFKKYGYEEIFCENLSMKEKIGLFKNADFIAGPIGGGLSNTIFCPRSTTVISINSPEFFDVNKRLEYAMIHTNLVHFDHTNFVNRNKDIVTGKDALSISGGMNSPWSVNLSELKKLLDNLG